VILDDCGTGSKAWQDHARHVTSARELPKRVRSSRLRAGVQDVYGFQAELIIGLRLAGRQGNTAKVVPAFYCRRAGTKLIKRRACGVEPASHRFAYGRRGVLHIRIVCARNQRSGHHIAPPAFPGRSEDG